MSAEDVREMLRLGPPELQRAVLDVVRLGGARKMPAGAAEQVVRTMRHGEQRRRGRLRMLLGGVFVHGFGNADELGVDDCVKLLGKNTAEEVLERAPGLRSLLGWDVPVALARWGLVRVVLDDRPLAVVALGLLAAEPVERMPGARTMWEALREEHPALPALPVGLLVLRRIAAGEAGEGPPDLEQLAAELDELRGRLVPAADAAERIAGHLRDGHRPEEGDLVLVQCAAADFDGLRMRIGTVLPGEQPVGLDALATALRAAVEAGRKDDRVRSLRRIEGPESEAGLLAEVRQAADDGDVLAVLAELIQLRAQDRLRALALVERARAELPECWHRPEPAEPSVEIPAPREAADDAEPSPAADEDELDALDAFLAGAVPAIRQWMLEDSLGFPDDAGQRELLCRTGGWPTLVGRVVTGLAARDRDQALVDVLRQVRGRLVAFLDDTGVRADPCLAAAWGVLVQEDDRGTAEDLTALLTLYGEDGTPGFAAADLREHGYDGTRDLVEALVALGALETADGMLGCEPVLADAARRAVGG
ncbi:hypothetical protein [Actinomadura darangshiensis]|uniref:hypothetical protein n=1 Tax=Actinomadura darangshiensis TaxID=705336 RepID=UPI001407CA78|nr:hypothetical protein [Actinomadura darangshiensis]